MQLIEIIQLALIVFVLLSILVFLGSYLLYRKKSETKDIAKSKINDKKIDEISLKTIEDLSDNIEPAKEIKPVKQNPRFEVFVPDNETKIKTDKPDDQNKKSHDPKTISIKPKS